MTSQRLRQLYSNRIRPNQITETAVRLEDHINKRYVTWKGRESRGNDNS